MELEGLGNKGGSLVGYNGNQGPAHIFKGGGPRQHFWEDQF